MHAQSRQSCPTLCDSMNHSLSGSSVHDILQARIVEWVAMPSSGDLPNPRDQTRVSSISCIAVRFFTAEPLRKPVTEKYSMVYICVYVCVCVCVCVCIYYIFILSYVDGQFIWFPCLGYCDMVS